MGMQGRTTRRRFLQQGTLAASGVAWTGRLRAQGLETLHVASAGSMRAMLEGPLTDASRGLGLQLVVHAEGADAVAHGLVEGSITADVFIPITASAMQTVIRAGKVRVAQAIGRTELVLVYSPASRFAPQFDAAAAGRTPWWQVLQQPGMRVGRGNPEADPGARAIVFALMLAAEKFHQPKLAQTVLGPTLNPLQIVPGVQAKLRSGELDVSSSYRIAALGGTLPFITLPEDINLSRMDVTTAHPDVRLAINGRTFAPEPLVFYAAALERCANPAGAAKFVAWLRGVEGQTLLAQHGFVTAGDLPPLQA